MEKLNKAIEKAIDELVEMATNDAEVKKYLLEICDNIVEEDITLCVIEYITNYYNVTKDIVYRNS